MTQSASQTIDFRRFEGRVRASRALALVRLIRPLNMMIVGAGVFVGGFLAEGGRAFDPPHLASMVLAAFSVIGIAAGANSLNDVADEEIDRINRPGRPVASGLVSRNVALTIWIGGTLAGLILAATLSAAHLIIAVAAAASMAVYNFRLKRVPLAGNVLVSLLVALALVYGALTLGAPGAALYAAGFAFLVTLAREVVKDVEDLEGDRLAGARTIAVAMGEAPARRIGAAVIAVSVLTTPVPFLFSGYSGLYLSVVLIAAVLLVAAMSEVMSEGGSMSRASTRLKLAMVVGLAALAFAHALD